MTVTVAIALDTGTGTCLSSLSLSNLCPATTTTFKFEQWSKQYARNRGSETVTAPWSLNFAFTWAFTWVTKQKSLHWLGDVRHTWIFQITVHEPCTTWIECHSIFVTKLCLLPRYVRLLNQWHGFIKILCIQPAKETSAHAHAHAHTSFISTATWSGSRRGALHPNYSTHCLTWSMQHDDDSWWYNDTWWWCLTMGHHADSWWWSCVNSYLCVLVNAIEKTSILISVSWRALCCIPK